MNNKIWVVTYYDIPSYHYMVYSDREPTVTCFNNKENAMKYYEYILGEHDVVDIDECEVYTEFKVWNS